MRSTLAQVFQCLCDANLKLQIKKCSFYRDTVKFLGHVISSAGTGTSIATDPDKIEKVSQWPVPVSVWEVRQFFGLVNYYRQFVKNCSELAKPLYCLTIYFSGLNSVNMHLKPCIGF